MVHKLRCMNTKELLNERRVATRLAIALLLILTIASATPAQESGVHYWHQGAMPPGAIGSRQLQRGGPLPGFFQPVEIKAPPGVLVSLAVGEGFDEPQPVPLRVGMLIGKVYRLRVMNIPLHPGMEVFPTVEIIDRLYAPPDRQQRFAIPIQLTQEELQFAMQGKFVTRVIYLEDPRNALPARGDPNAQNWFEAGPGRDPLAVADALGRPVAILRLGARLPDDKQLSDPHFLFGSPPWLKYPPATAVPAPPAASVEPAAPVEGEPAP